jgi:hypothetical protein
LYSTDWVLEYPVFFDGNRLDRTLNGDLLMPPGCSVTMLQGVKVCHPDLNGGWRICSGVAASQNRSDSWGFIASRDPAASPRDLTANIHVWHDGWSEIRVRAVYTVFQPAGVDCSVAGKTQLTPL